MVRADGAAARGLRYRVPIQLTADTAGLPVAPVAASALFNPTSFAVSPDGRAVVFQARTNGGIDGRCSFAVSGPWRGE